MVDHCLLAPDQNKC